MCKIDDQISAYKAAVQMYGIETQAHWRQRAALLILHGILLSVLFKMTTSPAELRPHAFVSVFWCTIGLFISLLTYAVDRRAYVTCLMRMCSAKRLENKSWWLFRGPLNLLLNKGSIADSPYEKDITDCYNEEREEGKEEKFPELKLLAKRYGGTLMCWTFGCIIAMYLFLTFIFLFGNSLLPAASA